MSMNKMILNSKKYSKNSGSFKARLNRLVFGCPKLHHLDLRFL